MIVLSDCLMLLSLSGFYRDFVSDIACVYLQLIVVTLISYLSNFKSRFGVQTVGYIPTGYVSMMLCSISCCLSPSFSYCQFIL